MNSLDSNASSGKGVSGSAELRRQRSEWTENWFAGNASCPNCGGDDMQVVRTCGDESGRIEDWRCALRSCASRWRVELRESALGIDRDADGLEAEWYERAGDTRTFRILVEDGIVRGVHALAGSTVSGPSPRFIVREYGKHALNMDHFCGTDEEGRDYYEYRPAENAKADATPAEVHSVLVTCTAHVTVQEAQALTDHGYSRGEYGWLIYVGRHNAPVLPELEPLNEGLRGVIREAHARGCLYVLLDRDADPLSGIATYDW
jgi:hypothetical protein